jgi:hypothetical protein
MQRRTSPSGLLHVGNVYSALLCEQWAKANHAQPLLRIEDINHAHCRLQPIDTIIEDHLSGRNRSDCREGTWIADHKKLNGRFQPVADGCNAQQPLSCYQTIIYPKTA